MKVVTLVIDMLIYWKRVIVRFGTQYPTRHIHFLDSRAPLVNIGVLVYRFKYNKCACRNVVLIYRSTRTEIRAV